MCLVCDASDRKINPHILKGCSPLGSPERNILIYKQYCSSIEACFIPARLAQMLCCFLAATLFPLCSGRLPFCGCENRDCLRLREVRSPVCWRVVELSSEAMYSSHCISLLFENTRRPEITHNLLREK